MVVSSIDGALLHEISLYGLKDCLPARSWSKSAGECDLIDFTTLGGICQKISLLFGRAVHV